jgi:hypothetical protein
MANFVSAQNTGKDKKPNSPTATFTKNASSKITNDTMQQAAEKTATSKLYFGILYQSKNEFDRAENALLEAYEAYKR